MQLLRFSSSSAAESNTGQCIICDRRLPMNRTGYLKHIGVDHELVVEYLEKDASVQYIPPEIYKKQNNPHDESEIPGDMKNLTRNAKDPGNDIRACLDTDSE